MADELGKSPIVVEDGPRGYLCFSRDGTKLLSFSSDNAKVQAWDTTTWKAIGPGIGHGAWVYRAEFDAKAERVLTLAATESGSAKDVVYEVKVWDTRTGEMVGPGIRYRPLLIDAASGPDAAISPDGRFVATAHSHDYSVDLWDVETGRFIRAFSHPYVHNGIDWVRFDSKGSTLVTSAYGGGTWLWTVQTGQMRTALPTTTLATSDVRPALSDNGLIAVPIFSGFDVYEMETGKLILRKEGLAVVDRLTIPQWLSISADGSRVALKFAYEEGAIWDVHTGRKRLDLLTQEPALGPRGTIAFLPDTAELWSLTSGRFIRGLGRQDRYAAKGVFSPDGNTLVLMSTEGTLILFARPGLKGAERWLADESAEESEK